MLCVVAEAEVYLTLIKLGSHLPVPYPQGQVRDNNKGSCVLFVISEQLEASTGAYLGPWLDHGTAHLLSVIRVDEPGFHELCLRELLPRVMARCSRPKALQNDQRRCIFDPNAAHIMPTAAMQVVACGHAGGGMQSCRWRYAACAMLHGASHARTLFS